MCSHTTPLTEYPRRYEYDTRSPLKLNCRIGRDYRYDWNNDMLYTNCPKWIFCLSWSLTGPILTVLLIVSSYADVKGTLFSKSTYDNTIGTVMTSHLIETHAQGATSYGYLIRYKYTVQNHQYYSNIINFNLIKSDAKKDFAEKILAKYTISKRVTVYYLRNHPQFGVLSPHVPLATKVFTCFMLFLFLLSGFGIGMSYRLRLKA